MKGRKIKFFFEDQAAQKKISSFREWLLCKAQLSSVQMTVLWSS